MTQSNVSDFIFSNDFYRSVDLMVTTSGHEKCQPSHSYGPAVRSAYMFHYIHRGKGIYRVHGREYSLKAGDLFYIVPGEKIYYEADASDPWEYSWIGLRGMKFEDYISRTIFVQTPVAAIRSDVLPDLFIRLQEASKLENADLLFNACAYEFMFELTQQLPLENRKPAAKEAYTEMILRYIEQNFDRPITVQEIADRLALDRSYVHRLFKKKMQMSVKEYILSLRLADACSYLIYSDLSISEISRTVGYEDTLYFSRLFHQKKGCSPSEYRKRKRQEKQKAGQAM